MPDSCQSSASSVGAATDLSLSKYERLIAAAKRVPSAKAVVVHPCDETSLRGAVEAAQSGLIDPIFVGPEAKIRRVAREQKIDIAKFELAGAAHSHAAAAKSGRIGSGRPGRNADERQLAY
jgi:phosphate acetyltransferase